jgi:hypothetical protein
MHFPSEAAHTTASNKKAQPEGYARIIISQLSAIPPLYHI